MDRAAGEPPQQEAVDGAEGQLAGLGDGAAGLGGAPVLPYQCVMQRQAGRPLPQDRGLALVGDAQRRDRAVLGGAPVQHLAADGQRVRPDGVRVVLDPARLRVDLLQLALRGGDGCAGGVEDDRPCAGRALVEGQQVRAAGHVSARSRAPAIPPGRAAPRRHRPSR